MDPYRNTSSSTCTQQSTRLQRLVAWLTACWAESLLGVYLVCLTLIWVACAAVGSAEPYVILHFGSGMAAVFITVSVVGSTPSGSSVSPAGVVGLTLLWAHWMVLLTSTALVQAFG